MAVNGLNNPSFIFMALIKFDKVEQISNMLDVEMIEYGLFCGNDWKYTVEQYQVDKEKYPLF